MNRLPRLVAPLLALAALNISAAVEHVAVFTADTEGYHTFRIPAVLRAADGTLLAFAEGRRQNAADKGDIDLVLRRSEDGGRTWEPLQVIWDDADNTCGNPCAVLDEQTGVVWMLGTHNLGTDAEAQIIRNEAQGTRTVWLLSSADHGRTWSRPVPQPQLKPAAWGWYATGPGVGIQIRRGPHAGRLVIPCDHSYADPAGQRGGGPYEYGAHAVHSDDHGRTWQLGGVVRPKMNECQVVELADEPGRLLLNLRSYRDRQCRAEAFSADGGRTWTAPRDQPALPEPRCQASLIRHRWPAAGRPGVLLFANPPHPGERRDLTVRLSEDDGRTWPRSLRLHEGFSAYSSLVSLDDATAGCLHECGDGGPRRGYQSIVFTRFALRELQPDR